MDISENKKRSLRGELYHAFTPELVAERRRCAAACSRYNNTAFVNRRHQVKLFQDIVGDNNPLPPPASKEEDDEALFDDDPWVEPPFRIDYGTNLRLGKNVYINFNCVVIDTCVVSIGARTLLAPNVSLYSGTHPLDPDLRNGTQGPESGKPITIEEDVWIGGDVVVLPGVVVGRGSVVGAGSVVTKNVAPYTVVAGNPAKFIKDAPRDTITPEEREQIYKIAQAEDSKQAS